MTLKEVMNQEYFFNWKELYLQIQLERITNIKEVIFEPKFEQTTPNLRDSHERKR